MIIKHGHIKEKSKLGRLLLSLPLRRFFYVGTAKLGLDSDTYVIMGKRRK